MAISNDKKVKPRVIKTIKIDKSQKPEKRPPSASQMTFFEHLGELRSRMMWSALAVVACSVVGWIFHKELFAAFQDLITPASQDLARQGKPIPRLITLDITSSFSVYFELSLYAGLLLASPVLVYHVLAFMAPALEPETQPGEIGHEGEVKMLKAIRRSLVFFIPLVAVFFIIGIAFAYYVILPAAVRFLVNFPEGQFETFLDVKKFIGQMSKIMFWSGVVSELPIFMFLLARLRIVNWKRLAGYWKIALVLSMVAAALITPSPEIFSQALIAVPVFGLFWLGVLFARFA